MPLDYVISAFVTLLVVVDPIGLVPVFAGLTAGLPQQARQQVAVRACAIAAAILFGTAIAGEFLLRSLGITPRRRSRSLAGCSCSSWQRRW